MTLFDQIKKYFWIIVLVLSLGLGWLLHSLIMSPPAIDPEFEKWKKDRELYQKQHISDSITYSNIIKLLNKQKTKDSLNIITTQHNYEQIKFKYQEELNRIRSFDADNTLWFFSRQTQTSNDW